MLIPSYLVNEHFDDRYFDVVNALDEAQQIYFRNNNLIERISMGIESKTPFIIGETGFGAGRVVVSLLEFMEKSGLKNISIEYNSVEMYPMSPEKMIYILNGFKDRVGKGIDTLVEAYRGIDITVAGWHSLKLEQSFGTLELNLWIGEALEMVTALKKSCDVWFLDGHSPKKNPSIWRPELLLEIGKKTKIGGTCSTFTVAGVVKRALVEAGFTIKKLPGCGGKNEVLQGEKCCLI
jgi:tRNA U34 5-methylaminomethyl-2-thiouridine-forming methyltransferase MnmC